MKKLVRSTSFLVIGLLLISSCSDEKTGKSPKLLAEKIDTDQEMTVEDTVSLDSMILDEPEVIPPPPPVFPPIPPEPLPPDPWPDPDPYPIPEPEPIPEPIPWQDPEPNPVIDFPHVDPEFPGGNEEMMKFIQSNIEYPKVDVEMNNQGRVYVEFIVEKDGLLSNMKILRGVSKTIDQEAIRVMKKMPKWKPGEVRDKSVRCKSRLPLTFHLD